MDYGDFEVPDGIQPLVGYRGWRVKDDALWSVYPDIRSVEWPIHGPLQSECLRPKQRGRDDHDSDFLPSPPKHYWTPHLDCTCGIYALHQYPKLFKKREDGRKVRTFRPWPDDSVTGIIHAWGRMIVGDKGFRAQSAKPIALVSRPRSNRWPKVIERLAERYGLEIVDARDLRSPG